MKQKISIINKSNGNYSMATINGREHIVTTMVAIEGDSVMNELLYPNAVVQAAMHQLDMLPAPDMHPEIDGVPVSAFNPLAINANNFGGFTRSPRSDNKRILTDLAIDLDVANRTERGTAIVNRIKAGKRIGVSTGLLADVSESNGAEAGKKFNGRVEMINFDHVAVLLDAEPAGENTYTINHSVQTNKSRGIFMDKLELDLTSLALADRVKLGNLKVNELLDHVNHKTTLEEATAVVLANGKHIHDVDEASVSEFLANKDGFEDYLENAEKALQEKRDFIIANSKMTAEQLEALDESQLDALALSVAPKNKYVNTRGNKRSEPELVLLDDVNMQVSAEG